MSDPHFSDLAREGITLTKYYAQTHPSQPNYIASIAGDYFGLDHDDDVRIPGNVSTIVDLLDWKDMSWAGYFENIPGPGYMAHASDSTAGNGGWDYVRKHNPFVSFDSINKNGTRLLNIQSFDEFKQDMAGNIVPQFVFMSPNMLNDGHNTTLEYATTWAREFLAPMLADKAFKERTLIMLTYDEADTYSQPNKIASLLLGSALPNELKGSKDDTYYTHYSILSTMQYNWALPCLGRYDVGANIFKNVADYTLYQNPGDPDNLASVDNSLSYPGFLNNDPAKWVKLPAPNLKLVGAGGLPVLESIRNKWGTEEEALTPYDGSGEAFDGRNNLPEYVAQTANMVLLP